MPASARSKQKWAPMPAEYSVQRRFPMSLLADSGWVTVQRTLFYLVPR